MNCRFGKKKWRFSWQRRLISWAMKWCSLIGEWVPTFERNTLPSVLLWRWRQCILPKPCYSPTRLYAFETENTASHKICWWAFIAGNTTMTTTTIVTSTTSRRGTSRSASWLSWSSSPTYRSVCLLLYYTCVQWNFAHRQPLGRPSHGWHIIVDLK
jgi:hypothetical protein